MDKRVVAHIDSIASTQQCKINSKTERQMDIQVDKYGYIKNKCLDEWIERQKGAFPVYRYKNE